ncbi:MAG: SH3 domain-containing protein [Peptococcaceae bacterium]|nr:MAG: SH3 domain-containing protein [Peptococcaceae bacterium]
MWILLALFAILLAGLLLIVTVIQFEIGSPAAVRWLVYTLCSIAVLAYVLGNRPPREQVEYSYMPLPAVQEKVKIQADKNSGRILPTQSGNLAVTDTGLSPEQPQSLPPAQAQNPPPDGAGTPPPALPAAPAPDSAPQETTLKRAVVNTAGLNVRTRPDFASQIAGTVKAGVELVILEEPGGSDWLKVRTADSVLTGWVHRDYVKILQAR